jgi:hypothetical protein
MLLRVQLDVRAQVLDEEPLFERAQRLEHDDDEEPEEEEQERWRELALADVDKGTDTLALVFHADQSTPVRRVAGCG